MKFRKTYTLPYSAKRMFQVWTSSETVIPPATRMELNPVVGGQFRLMIETPEFTSSNEGVYSEVSPDSRLKYTWEWNKDGNVTEVSVDFMEAGDGSQIRVVHAGFGDVKDLAMHEAGWDSYIKGLTHYLEQANGE